MALELSRFFDASDDDRIYQAEQFAGFFRLFLTDGIKNGGENLRVTARTGMQVKVNFGTALVQGYGYWLEDDTSGQLTLTVPNAEGQPRIDRVVVRLDRGVLTRSIQTLLKKGTAAATPAAPELQRDANVWELSLAKIAVGAGAPSVTSDNITDERYNPAVCGLINSLIELDAAEFFSQAATILYNLENQGYLPIDAEMFGGKAADSAKLDGKEPGAYANVTHTHAQSDIADLATALAGKSNTGHTHAQSDIADLATALAGKSNTGHTHSGANITSGEVPFARLPTGTGASQVAKGNHTHNYAAASHSHSGGQVIHSYGTSDPGTLANGQIYVKI